MDETRLSPDPTVEKLSSPPDSDLDYSDSHEDMDRHSSHASAHASKQHQDLELAKTKSIAETMSPMREILFVGLLCSAQFVTQAGLLGTLNILHIIGPDLGITDPGILSWLIAGYSLTVGTFILLSGRCGDLFGYKNMLIVGFVWFAIWNIVAGCSVYVDGNGGQVLFIFSRVLGGIGPAILLPNALGLLGATYNEGRRKDMVFSLFGACAPGKYSLIDSLVCFLTFCRWCCSRRDIRWIMVAFVVAVDLLDVWHCALLPCLFVNLHSSLGAS